MLCDLFSILMLRATMPLSPYATPRLLAAACRAAALRRNHDHALRFTPLDARHSTPRFTPTVLPRAALPALHRCRLLIRLLAQHANGNIRRLHSYC